LGISVSHGCHITISMQYIWRAPQASMRPNGFSPMAAEVHGLPTRISLRTGGIGLGLVHYNAGTVKPAQRVWAGLQRAGQLVYGKSSTIRDGKQLQMNLRTILIRNWIVRSATMMCVIRLVLTLWDGRRRPGRSNCATWSFHANNVAEP